MLAATGRGKYKGGITLSVLVFWQNWLQLSPTSTQRPMLCRAIMLPKCQLESRLRGGAVLGRIY